MAKRSFTTPKKTDTISCKGESAGRSQGSILDSTPATIVFEVSDLIFYFRNARLPTGIQRVQAEAITNALSTNTGRAIRICCFSARCDYWVEIAASDFVAICQLSLLDGDSAATEWTVALARLNRRIDATGAFVFPDGAFLVNLGSSWWLPNYFLNIRRAKDAHNIRYVPFVHDLIPVMTPEHCDRQLIADFIGWALGVYEHADFFLANSESTKKDLVAVGSRLSHEIPDEKIVVVRLDADFRKPTRRSSSTNALARWRLDRGPFVLFVSTVESRKNHLAAFEAWSRLIRRPGGKSTPKLVCVGHRGWLSEKAYARLESDDLLKKSVVMLSNLPDSDLALLYETCLFTIYPSLYEGWGLPVTESLCYGKIPVISRSSSLPEAGGEFAAYFDANETDGLAKQLERLLSDPELRRTAEEKIRTEFRPRTWLNLARQIEIAIGTWASGAGPSVQTQVRAAAFLGAYCPLVQSSETRLRRGIASASLSHTSPS